MTSLYHKNLDFKFSPINSVIASTIFDWCVYPISPENEHGKFNTQALKAITAGDPVQLEMKGQNPFTDVYNL